MQRQRKASEVKTMEAELMPFTNARPSTPSGTHEPRGVPRNVVCVRA